MILALIKTQVYLVSRCYELQLLIYQVIKIWSMLQVVKWLFTAYSEQTVN